MFFSILLSIAAGVIPASRKMDNFCAMTSGQFLESEALVQRIDFANPDTALLDAAVFHLTNAERKRYGLKPLAFSQALYRSAQAHNKEMILHGYLEHENLRGLGFFDRIRRQDKSFMAGAENIATILPLKAGGHIQYSYKKRNGKYEFFTMDGKPIPVETYKGMAAKLVKSWMDSPGHKKNILNKELTHIGCSIVLPNSLFQSHHIPLCYGTQDFGAF